MKNLGNNAELLQDLSIEEMENVNGGSWGAAFRIARLMFEFLGGAAAASEMADGWNQAGSSRTYSWN